MDARDDPGFLALADKLGLTFALQVEPCPALSAGLGRAVELRELSYGAMKRAFRAGGGLEHATDALFAFALHVDGSPLGIEGLDALPGHLAEDINAAITRCLRMHGMSAGEPAAAPQPPPQPPPSPPDEPPPADAPQPEADEEEARDPPGEV